MRLLAYVLIPALVAAAFLAGRATSSGSAFAGATRHVWVGHHGDVLKVPAAATRCVVSGEGGSPDLFCSRIPQGRYTVTFFSDKIMVWRNGRPEKPAFSARWMP